jgi:hypothetical protein
MFFFTLSLLNCLCYRICCVFTVSILDAGIGKRVQHPTAGKLRQMHPTAPFWWISSFASNWSELFCAHFSVDVDAGIFDITELSSSNCQDTPSNSGNPQGAA